MENNKPLDIRRGVLIDFGKVIGLVTIGIFIGKSIQSDIDVQRDTEDNKQGIESVEQRVMQYVRDEVGGLRADWERNNTKQKERDQEQDRRLIKLEK